MSQEKKHQASDRPERDASSFNALRLLEKLGFRTLRGKLFFASLLFTSAAFTFGALITYGATFITYGGPQATIHADTSRIVWLGVATVGFINVLSYVLAASVASAAKSLLTATEFVRSGDLMARAGVKTGDELEDVSNGFNQVMSRLSKTIQTEESQKQALLVISKAVEDSGDGIAIRDFVRGTAHFNKKFAEMLKFPVAELDRAESTLAIFSDKEAARSMLETLDRGGSWSGETELRTRTGQPVPVSLRANPIKDESGRIIGRIVIYTDITDRKHMEAVLMNSEAEYRTLFESANDPILIFDPETEELLEVNNQACLTYGFDHGELVGMSLKNLTRDVERGQEFLNETLKMGKTDAFETVHIRKDGKPISIMASTSVIDYRGKKAILGIARDITGRKQAEEVLQRSLNDFLRLVSIVSEGDLTRRGDGSEGPLAGMSSAVNRMLDNFSEMLTRVKQIGLSVTSSATQILAASEEIAAGAQRQADEITNTSSAVEEMAASMSQVSRNAEASAEAARRALDMAEHGDRSVRDTSEAMNRIDLAVQGTAEKMRMLAKRSSEISEIIDLINDVAAQTNLLSLNAAIEAAHAGEAGLGFSVVADEIRKLAERSARATRDVGALIKAIQNETSEALDAMENGMREVRDGNTLAEQARGSLQDISNVVRQSAELIEEISAASEEQARVTRNLAGAMQTVSSITLETSAGAHQTAQTIQGMVSLSEQLNEAISQFKVSEDLASAFAFENGGHAQSVKTNGSSGFGRQSAD